MDRTQRDTWTNRIEDRRATWHSLEPTAVSANTLISVVGHVNWAAHPFLNFQSACVTHA